MHGDLWNRCISTITLYGIFVGKGLSLSGWVTHY